MHDLSHARTSYDDVDTVVLDDPDEVLMHVLVPTAVDWATAGAWHKRIPNGSSTACGVPIDQRFAFPRREELTGNLCTRCFTEFERGLAAEADADIDAAAAEPTPPPTLSNGRQPTLRGLAVSAVFDRKRRRTAIPKLKK